MRSRWFHAPRLHSPAPGEEKKVGWLELFYDLVYVATIIQLGNALSAYPSPPRFAAFMALFAPIWLAWTSFTFYANRFTVDDFAHRGVVFLQMFGVAAMAVAVPRVLEGDPQPFAIAYGVTRLAIVALYARTFAQLPEAREYSRVMITRFGVDGALWLVSAFLDAPWCYALWALGAIFSFSLPLNRHSRDLLDRYPADPHHIAER